MLGPLPVEPSVFAPVHSAAMPGSCDDVVADATFKPSITVTLSFSGSSGESEGRNFRGVAVIGAVPDIGALHSAPKRCCTNPLGVKSRIMYFGGSAAACALGSPRKNG